MADKQTVEEELETFAKAWVKYISVATLSGERATTREGTETAIKGYNKVVEDFTNSLNQLLIKERLSEARRALRYNEGSQDAQLIRISNLENQLGEKS